ncbi:MAG: hypothetical protein JSV49_12615 [Thermoplasmata archaeon]|nr:MAG: hypothetical protein JSV49_12615 [Thermoplasmata archaeon]
MKIQVWEDFSKTPKFKSYSSLPAGIEIVEGSFRSNPFELDKLFNFGREEGGVALWDNTGMPLENDWDEEIHHINKIQKNLGELSDQVRLVRCFISTYDMMHYNYPKAIAQMLGAIGTQKYQHTAPIGWHVPWWPPYQSKRTELLDVYITFLKSWVQQEKSLTIRTSKQYKNEVLRKIYAKLGEWSAPKRNYVLLVIEKLELYRSVYAVPEGFWSEREKTQYDLLVKNKLDMAIKPIEAETKTSRDKDELLKRIESFNGQLWHHSFFDEVDSWLDWIGKGIKINFERVDRKRNETIIKTCTNFVKGLTLFMSHSTGKEKDVEQYVPGLQKMFGKATEEQVWLLACLWKTMAEQLKINLESPDYQLKSKLENDWLFKL